MDDLGRFETFGRMRGRHPDVNSREVRSGRANEVDEFDAVSSLPDHLESRTLEQAGQTFTKQYVVVSDHDACSAASPAAFASQVCVGTATGTLFSVDFADATGKSFVGGSRHGDLGRCRQTSPEHSETGLRASERKSRRQPRASRCPQCISCGAFIDSKGMRGRCVSFEPDDLIWCPTQLRELLFVESQHQSHLRV